MSTSVSSSRKGVPPRIGDVGPNVTVTSEWKERLNQVVEEKRLTLREVASHARDQDGRLLAHSTVRTALVETSNTIRVETLAAICDSLGVDIVSILTGKDFAYLKAPDGADVVSGGSVRVLPIVPMARAAHWDEDVRSPDSVLGVTYLPAYNTEGYKAALIGDASMSPRAHKGDIVIFKEGKPRDGALAIVQPKGGSAIFRNYMATADGVELTARNPDFSKQIVPAANIDFEAEVVSIIENVA